MKTENPSHTDSGYRRILKSTFIMGGSSVLSTILGIIRTKIIALLLGPSGVGLTGIYMTVISLVSTISGMGIRECGVRQIAGACGTGDTVIISQTIVLIRRTAILSGLAGLGILFILSASLSRFTFGNADRSSDIAILSAAIFLTAVSGGQTALIQGLQRIDELAKLSMLGALFGTLFSIPIIYFFGEKGIASYLVIVAATSVLASWLYCRKVELTETSGGWWDFLSKVKPLLKLGAAFMLGALMTYVTQYLLRVFVVRYYGLSAAGVYQASTTLSVVYVHIILNAMLTDFYPRLSAAAHDNIECISLINKQIEVGLLLAVPGILAIMTFAPSVITIFYSSKFMLAVDILRWQILGVVLQVVAWPMGFLLRAKGNAKLFFWSELFANCMHLGLAWLAINYFGLSGIGMAFFGMNLFYWAVIYWIVRTQYKFKFSMENIQLLVVFTVVILIVFSAPLILPRYIHIYTNSMITIIVGLASLKIVVSMTDNNVMPQFLVKIRSCLKF